MPKTAARPTKAAKPAQGSALTHRLRSLEDFRMGWPLADLLRDEWADLMERTTGLIRVEEAREDGNIVVRAELPGIDPDKDVHVTLEDDVLTIHAERRDERSEESEGTRRTEFHYGSMTRRLHVPRGIDPEAIEATYRDGILTVRVPAPTPQAETREIAVHRAES